MSKVVGTAVHPVDLSDGRSLAPGETAENVDTTDDEYNKQLALDGHIYVIGDDAPPAHEEAPQAPPAAEEEPPPAAEEAPLPTGDVQKADEPKSGGMI